MKTAFRICTALGIVLLAACAPREILLPAVGLTPYRLADFPPGYTPPLSSETGQPMPGFGGAGPLDHTPVIFIHGNTVSARYWLPARRYFKTQGFQDAGLWSLGYGWDNVRYFDSADLSVPSVERMVQSVTQQIAKDTGKPVDQVDIISHSLGVTLARQWMKQTNSWHKVRNFIGVCGANDGVWTADSFSRGQNRGVAFELAPGSPWLKQLRDGGDTPGPTRYMTLYDGTGRGDVLFPPPYENSSALEGANNLAFNVVHGSYLDHLELPRVPETMDAMIEWMRQAPEPSRSAMPPALVRQGELLRAEPPDAQVFCEKGGAYPTSRTAAAAAVTLEAGVLTTCFARQAATGLASPMSRYKRGDKPLAAGKLTVTADRPANSYENPISVALTASEPEAFIVYTTSGTKPNSGSPLYTAPVYVAGPLRLTAVAIAPDGSQSAPLVLDYDISLELIEAERTLQRQFDSDTPSNYEGKRKKGR
ncbi:MAG: chitobiase/beta-hexosaminidase C-terminal domain-containing protein [Pseudomonadota bacterium]